jgi:periplasmic glucans biosynthesis protein
VVDFKGGQLPALGENAKLVPVISASRGRVEITSVRPLRSINGYRAMFDLALADESVEPVNLRMYISDDGQALSETWLYQYTPPPPPLRKL